MARLYSPVEVGRRRRRTPRSAITTFGKIRRRIAEECERQSPFKNGEVEVDESYFGPRRVRGKRGRGAGRKTIVFGLLKRDGKVYTEIVADCRKTTLPAGGVSSRAYSFG